jgi:hypothetical protein
LGSKLGVGNTTITFDPQLLAKNHNTKSLVHAVHF